MLAGLLVSCADDDAAAPAAKAPDDLTGELIAEDDLDGSWSRLEPHSDELLGGGTDEPGVVTAVCPDGEDVPLPDRALGETSPDAVAVIMQSRDDVDDEVTHWLQHDPSGELTEAFRRALDSCAGQEWEQGDDPEQHIRFETTDIEGLDEDVAAYRVRWGLGDGEFDLTDMLAVGRSNGVAVFVWVTTDDATGRAEEIVGDALRAALQRLDDGVWTPGVLDTPVAPEVLESATVRVVEPGRIAVVGNGGCELLAGPDGYHVSNPSDFQDELPRNVQWFVEQVFDVDPQSDVSLDRARATINVYAQRDVGEIADADATVAIATELESRLANRSICR